jgi:hypothetical protein
MPKFEKTVQIIQFEILVNQKSKKHFHHISVYVCANTFKPNGTMGQECGAKTPPLEITENCMQNWLLAWGVGGTYVNLFTHTKFYFINITFFYTLNIEL